MCIQCLKYNKKTAFWIERSFILPNSVVLTRYILAKAAATGFPKPRIINVSLSKIAGKPEGSQENL